VTEANEDVERDVVTESDRTIGARTVTVLDNALTRHVGQLSAFAIFVIVVCVYAGIGLVLPLATDSSTAGLIALNFFGAAWSLVLVLAWLLPIVEARVRRQLLEQTTNLRLLSAHEFELVVGELLRREGWAVEETGRHGEPDGGIDLRIQRAAEQRLVQCKRWDSRQVGVDQVRMLAGTLMRERLPAEAGTLVTLSDFTTAAQGEAASIGIQLIDNAELVRRLQAVGATDLLRQDTTRARYPCPDCGTAMLLAKSPIAWWLRCPRHGHGCKGKRDLSRDPEVALQQLAKLL
jgi:HJR/Mrr/RecB family endonuclease